MPVPVRPEPARIDAHLSGHMGETRDDRLADFCAVNPSESVIALREGSLLHIPGNDLYYFSAQQQSFKVFHHGAVTQEYNSTQALGSFLPLTTATDIKNRVRSHICPSYAKFPRPKAPPQAILGINTSNAMLCIQKMLLSSEITGSILAITTGEIWHEKTGVFV